MRRRLLWKSPNVCLPLAMRREMPMDKIFRALVRTRYFRYIRVARTSRLVPSIVLQGVSRKTFFFASSSEGRYVAWENSDISQAPLSPACYGRICRTTTMWFTNEATRIPDSRFIKTSAMTLIAGHYAALAVTMSLSAALVLA